MTERGKLIEGLAVSYHWSSSQSFHKISNEEAVGERWPSVVEDEPVCSRPPACISMRISTGERRGFCISAPSSTRASLMYSVRAEGSVNPSPKLVELSRADETFSISSSAATFSIRA